MIRGVEYPEHITQAYVGSPHHSDHIYPIPNGGNFICSGLYRDHANSQGIFDVMDNMPIEVNSANMGSTNDHYPTDGQTLNACGGMTGWNGHGIFRHEPGDITLYSTVHGSKHYHFVASNKFADISTLGGIYTNPSHPYWDGIFHSHPRSVSRSDEIGSLTDHLYSKATPYFGTGRSFMVQQVAGIFAFGDLAVTSSWDGSSSLMVLDGPIREYLHMD